MSEAVKGISRRDFLMGSATVTAAALASRFPAIPGAYAAAGGTIRVGVIGCGGRGGGAAEQIVRAAPGVQITALGDLFGDRLSGLRGRLNGLRDRLQELGDVCKVTDDTCFTGFDAYQKVIAGPVDLVILATPPGFRPIHYKAAVEAGKHVFMEKPVAVCPAGVRSVLESSALAKQKSLGVVAGTQRRHQVGYVQCIKRLHDGAIGDIVSGSCWWNQGGLWKVDQKPEMSEMEWQIRNWLYFTWLSGDHICEQHVHNIDVMNWVMQSHPVKCLGMGGRQVRTAPVYGNIFDHFAIEYEYPNGARVTSMCRQIDGCANRVGETVRGTKGTASPGGSIRGESEWRCQEKNEPYVQELTDLIESVRAGAPLNEGQSIAESTLTAIMGRMSTYTGQEVTWDGAINSKLDLMRPTIEFGASPVDPVAVPGKTPLV